MVEYPIDEFAIIFNRIVDEENELIHKFVPVKVVQGYYCPDEECFIDTDQNVYSHMASLAMVGNVYACRENIAKVINTYENFNINVFKRNVIGKLNEYSYYKSIDEESNEFNKIMAKNKTTGEIKIYHDKDTKYYYELYDGAKEYLQSRSIMANNNTSSEKSTKAENEELERVKENILTPQKIISEVKKTIKGQDKAIETITTILWVKNNFPMIKKTNMLVVGPSGVGKTAIFKQLKEILDIPLTIYSITGNSQAGYKGHDIEEMLVQLYYDSGQNIEKTQNGIIIIDEFDKIGDNRDTGDIGTIAIQNELLKLIEGCTRMISLDNHNSINIDTSNILFVGCGAFANLYKPIEKKKTIGFGANNEEKNEDIIIDTETIVTKGGIIQELAGRLPVIVQLNSLSRENLKDILLNSEESYFRQVIMSIESLGIEIENIDYIVDEIVDDAMKKNTSGKIGARGIDNSVMNAFLKIFESIGNDVDKYSKVIIGKNIIKDNNDFELIPKQIKKKIKTM